MVNAERDSEPDSDLLVLTKDEELEVVMLGRLLDVSSLDDLKASSGCGRSETPPGLPISCSEGVIDGDFQSLSSSSAYTACNDPYETSCIGGNEEHRSKRALNMISFFRSAR